MLKWYRALGIFMALFLLSPITSHATVITFDDIDNPSSFQVPTDYSGFTWAINSYVASNDLAKNYNNSYVFTSSPNAFYNGNGVEVTIERNNPFNFEGAYFAYWGTNSPVPENSKVILSGYNGNNLVGEKKEVTLGIDFVWAGVNFLGINKLVLTPSGAEMWFFMDNFTYSANPVPVPPTVLLLGSGLLGLVGWRRFRKG